MFGAGQSIGNYRILSKIGTGGMGAVYLAEHPLIGKKVALKVIHRELSSNKEVVQRFFQEARSVNKIGSEHIVEIHDFGVTDNGDHFYIMEYLEGKTLANVLTTDKVLDVMRALRIGSQIAAALAATHQAGIIHRDLKPDNVMLMNRLGETDFVKVLDFGLAKVLAGTGVVKTAMGVLLGTPQYMSPEACESKQNIDHRTDIYALGVLLFQMMTGQLPFDGESMGEVLVKQVTQLPPAPRGINPSIPPSVEQVLLRCLAKQPDNRFPTMMALRDAVLDPEGYLRNSPPISPARSVAPGEAKVDAKTVMANAAALQKTRLGTAGGFPLPAPGPSLGPAPANMAPTVIAELVPVPPRAATAGPFAAVQMEPKNNTMRIATPLGYSSRPPRKMWPVVLVFGLVLGLGGGAFAVAWFGRKDDAGAKVDAARGSDKIVATADRGSDKGSGDSGSDKADVGSDRHPNVLTVLPDAAVPIDAAVAIEPPPPADAQTVAQLVIESVPKGAEVYGPDKMFLGKTPIEIEWPIAKDPVIFELRAVGYRRRTKQIVINSNTQMRLELERIPVQQHTNVQPHPGSGSAAGGNHDGLMRPDD